MERQKAALREASPQGRLERLREVLPELTIDSIKLPLTEAIERAAEQIEKRPVEQWDHGRMIHWLNQGEKLLLAHDREEAAQAVEEAKLAARKPRSAGGKKTASLMKQEAKVRAADVVTRYEKLMGDRCEPRTIAGIIAQRLKLKPDTVRRILKKTGLR